MARFDRIVTSNEAARRGAVELFRVLDRLTGDRLDAMRINVDLMIGPVRHYSGDIVVKRPISPLEDNLPPCKCCGGPAHVRLSCYGPHRQSRESLPMPLFQERFIPIQ